MSKDADTSQSGQDPREQVRVPRWMRWMMSHCCPGMKDQLGAQDWRFEEGLPCCFGPRPDTGTGKKV